MSCVPGMPCYPREVVVYKTYPSNCSCCGQSEAYSVRGADVYYSGANLSILGIQTQETLDVALQKIDSKMAPSELFAAFLVAMEDPTLKAQFCALVAECA